MADEKIGGDLLLHLHIEFPANVTIYGRNLQGAVLDKKTIHVDWLWLIFGPLQVQ